MKKLWYKYVASRITWRMRTPFFVPVVPPLPDPTSEERIAYGNMAVNNAWAMFRRMVDDITNARTDLLKVADEELFQITVHTGLMAQAQADAARFEASLAKLKELIP